MPLNIIEEIHDLAKLINDNKAFYDKAACHHFKVAMLYSQSSKSMTNCMKELKRSVKQWKKMQN